MKLWFKDKGAAEAKYGEMKQWGTSKATDMKELFRGKREFNEDLSAWNVSRVTNMGMMFWDCTAFNGTRYAQHHPHIHTHAHARQQVQPGYTPHPPLPTRTRWQAMCRRGM